MLVCYHRAAQSAISVGGGCVVTKQVALLINVLMWHYSGLYPPPFRLGFHTGRGCAVGITLNKHSNTILLAVSQSLVLVLQRESSILLSVHLCTCSDLELKFKIIIIFFLCRAQPIHFCRQYHHPSISILANLHLNKWQWINHWLFIYRKFTNLLWKTASEIWALLFFWTFWNLFLIDLSITSDKLLDNLSAWLQVHLLII